jgi:hypothetical protein
MRKKEKEKKGGCLFYGTGIGKVMKSVGQA